MSDITKFFLFHSFGNFFFVKYLDLDNCTIHVCMQMKCIKIAFSTVKFAKKGPQKLQISETADNAAA